MQMFGLDRRPTRKLSLMTIDPKGDAPIAGITLLLIVLSTYAGSRAQLISR